MALAVRRCREALLGGKRMSKTWLGTVAVLLAACSGNTTTQPDDGSGDRAGQGSGGSAAGNGSNAGGPSGGSSAAIAGAGRTAQAGVGGSAGAGGGQGASGGGGAGGPPTIPEDAGSGACHDYTPCGGDVVGSWDIEVCADPPLLGLRSFCPAATETLTMTGTADFR